MALPALAHAQTATPPLPLQFGPFVVGQSLPQVRARARELAGVLRCKQSRTDPALRECRAELQDSAGRPLQVWLSAVDSNASITTVAARLSTEELLRWQGTLVASYGRARERSRGSQHSLQWIRGNTMMRLTWRPEAPGVAVSVSLIDGGRLDDWGRRIEARLNAKRPPQPAPPDTAPGGRP